jgi:hypothetical protein
VLTTCQVLRQVLEVWYLVVAERSVEPADFVRVDLPVEFMQLLLITMVLGITATHGSRL